MAHWKLFSDIILTNAYFGPPEDKGFHCEICSVITDIVQVSFYIMFLDTLYNIYTPQYTNHMNIKHTLHMI